MFRILVSTAAVFLPVFAYDCGEGVWFRPSDPVLGPLSADPGPDDFGYCIAPGVWDKLTVPETPCHGEYGNICCVQVDASTCDHFNRRLFASCDETTKTCVAEPGHVIEIVASRDKNARCQFDASLFGGKGGSSGAPKEWHDVLKAGVAWKGENCLGVWETIECRGVWTIDFPNWDYDNSTWANGGKSVTDKHMWGGYDPEQGWWSRHFGDGDGVRYKCVGGVDDSHGAVGGPAVEQIFSGSRSRGSLFLNNESLAGTRTLRN